MNEIELKLTVPAKGAIMSYVNGLLFGAGFITAALIMKVLFHTGICG